jgi:hypothetical protein
MNSSDLAGDSLTPAALFALGAAADQRTTAIKRGSKRRPHNDWSLVVAIATTKLHRVID